MHVWISMGEEVRIMVILDTDFFSEMFESESQYLIREGRPKPFAFTVYVTMAGPRTIIIAWALTLMCDFINYKRTVLCD